MGGAALAFVWGLVLSAPGGAHYTMAAKAAPWVPIPTPTNLRLWPPGPLGRQFSLICPACGQETVPWGRGHQGSADLQPLGTTTLPFKYSTPLFGWGACATKG